MPSSEASRPAAAPLALAAIGAVLVGAWCIRAVPLLWHQDTCHYLELAASLARGDGYHSALNLFPDLIQPPLYPLALAALIRAGASPVGAATAICLGAAALTAVGLVRLHEALWGARGRLFAAAVGAASPVLALADGLESEPLFLLLALLALLAAIGALRRRSAAIAALAGLAAGGALLTRPEGVLVAAVLALLLAATGSGLGRAARVAAFGLALGAVATPYGLWVRARTGHFEVLPKLRFNRLLADVTAALPDEPGVPLAAKEMRALNSLMPDHATFILSRAFEDPGFDPRPLFPRVARSAAGRAIDLLRHDREVLSDAARRTGLLHPLALALSIAAFVAGTRRARPVETRVGVVALALLAFALLLPALLAGDAYELRFLAGATLFSLPLVAGGATLVADAVARRAGRPLAVEALLATLLFAAFAALTTRLAVTNAGGPASHERSSLITDACRRLLPEGARVVADHARCGWLAHGASLQLPTVDDLGALGDYLAAHRARYLLLDGRTLRRNPSAPVRGLIDPATWPRGWRALATLPPVGGDPLYLVELP